MSHKARCRPSWKKDRPQLRGYVVQKYADGGVHIYPKKLARIVTEEINREIIRQMTNPCYEILATIPERNSRRFSYNLKETRKR